MDEAQELIESFSMLDLSELLLAGISADIWISLAAAVFLIFFITRGYNRGVISEMAGLLSACATFVILRMCAVVMNPLLTVWFRRMNLAVTEEQARWLAGISLSDRIGRAVIYVLIGFFIYRLARFVIKSAGRLFRKLPVVGFLSAILGAVAGCVEGTALLLIFQIITGVDVVRAVLNTLDRLSVLAG